MLPSHAIGFDNDKYLKMQSEHIRQRISKFGDKLYLEFGGKLYDDFHASRVLPGFRPDSKLQMLLELKEDAEVIVVINSDDIEKNKTRADLGITYDTDVIRLVTIFKKIGLLVNSVVLTRYNNQPTANAFQSRLEASSLKVYHHYSIPNYPSNLPYVVSDDGYGKNDFIETSRKLVIVTAPGPGSGKMATCLSQLYHENKRGVKAGYAKFETFPIWNLPLRHPVNLAYEAATADLKDVNMIDPYHLDAYGVTTVNYNRDVDIFPVLNAVFTKIMGTSPYRSPTDMGVNMAGNCIIDDAIVSRAARNEIIRRMYNTLCEHKKGLASEDEVCKLQMLMQQAGVHPSDRPVIAAALAKEQETNAPAAALQLPDGTIVTGKTSDLQGPMSALLLKALKHVAQLDDSILLLSDTVMKPIQELKVNHLGNTNPRIHSDETLIALSICATTDPNAQKAINKLSDLRGCEAHSSVILSPADELTYKRLGINLTSEPKYSK